jgi:methyl-accepting chemotaxis protein
MDHHDERLSKIEQRLAHIETSVAVINRHMEHNDTLRNTLNARTEAMQSAITSLAQNMAVMTARHQPNMAGPVSAASAFGALGTALGLWIGKLLGVL